MTFSIGIISLLAAAFGGFVMYGNFARRWIAAWYLKKERPQDRVHLGAIALSSCLFIAGGFIQPQYDQFATCTGAGYTIPQCLSVTRA